MNELVLEPVWVYFVSMLPAIKSWMSGVGWLGVLITVIAAFWIIDIVGDHLPIVLIAVGGICGFMLALSVFMPDQATLITMKAAELVDSAKIAEAVKHIEDALKAVSGAVIVN